LRSCTFIADAEQVVADPVGDAVVCGPMSQWLRSRHPL